MKGEKYIVLPLFYFIPGIMYNLIRVFTVVRRKYRAIFDEAYPKSRKNIAQKIH